MSRKKRGKSPKQRARRIGYARVSTKDQKLALQIDALGKAGCRRIFSDRGKSGSILRRPALDKALAELKPGDELVTWKLDRLGRSLAHLIEVSTSLRDRNIRMQFLADSIDTTTPAGRLTFHIIGALAEYDRALISERTKAGMASAKARGAILGRPLALSSSQVRTAHKKLRSKKSSIATLAADFGVSRLTLARALKRSALHS